MCCCSACLPCIHLACYRSSRSVVPPPPPPLLSLLLPSFSTRIQSPLFSVNSPPTACPNSANADNLIPKLSSAAVVVAPSQKQTHSADYTDRSSASPFRLLLLLLWMAAAAKVKGLANVGQVISTGHHRTATTTAATAKWDYQVSSLTRTKPQNHRLAYELFVLLCDLRAISGAVHAAEAEQPDDGSSSPPVLHPTTAPVHPTTTSFPFLCPAAAAARARQRRRSRHRIIFSS